MSVVAIVGSGPEKYLPNLRQYVAEVDVWIGADRGAFSLIDRGIAVDYAVGDFDSVTAEELASIRLKAKQTDTYAANKNETDLELAINKAYDVKAEKVYLFGITGGRLDHELINMQLLNTILRKDIRGIIVDRSNQVELKRPGTHTVIHNDIYSYVSFVPFTEYVKNISLAGFAYPLKNYDSTWGSTRLISNQFISATGTVSFDDGLLLVVQSKDD